MSSRLPVGFALDRTTTGSGGAFASLSPEVRDRMVGRLGGTGLVYALGWASTYVFYSNFEGALHLEDSRMKWHVLSAISVAVGFGVFLLCRRRWIPTSAFYTLATAFQIIGAMSIYYGMLEWTLHGEAFVRRAAEAVDFGTRGGAAALVAVLEDRGIRILYHEGLTWVSMWILTFPLVVPMPLFRQIVATMASAAVVPAMLWLGVELYEAPTIGPWLLPYGIEATVPTFINAIVALACSRVVYGLTKDLSQAHRLGQYELVEPIGHGGMGQVWRARHQLLVRPAAVKLIRPELLADDDAVAHRAIARFEREVQLAAQLVHPHTITIYDYGRTEDGSFYSVMELLDGLNLDELVQAHGPVPAARAIHWLRQASASLGEAHAVGLIHRDVKPSNLFVCRYGVETDFLKVLDFGLVKRESDTADAGMTAERETPGTPAYMAPEMALGRDVDHRADLYSLGCVAYWLLTGSTVFEGTNAADMIVQHAREAPVPPSKRTELEVPEDLEAVVLSLLAKDPADRPQSAAELGDRLAACSESTAWSAAHAKRWWDLHRPQAS